MHLIRLRRRYKVWRSNLERYRMRTSLWPSGFKRQGWKLVRSCDRIWKTSSWKNVITLKQNWKRQTTYHRSWRTSLIKPHKSLTALQTWSLCHPTWPRPRKTDSYPNQHLTSWRSRPPSTTIGFIRTWTISIYRLLWSKSSTSCKIRQLSSRNKSPLDRTPVSRVMTRSLWARSWRRSKVSIRTSLRRLRKMRSWGSKTRWRRLN